jgi:hypothetical protein
MAKDRIQVSKRRRPPKKPEYTLQDWLRAKSKAHALQAQGQDEAAADARAYAKGLKKALGL